MQPDRVEKLIVEDMIVTVVTTLQGHQIAEYILKIEEAAKNVPLFYDLVAACDYIQDYFYASPVLSYTVSMRNFGRYLILQVFLKVG